MFGGADTLIMEAVVQPRSPVEGRTPAALQLRRRFGINLIGISRRGRPFGGRLSSFRLEGGDGEFKVSIRDLDGETTYQGTAAGPQIRFERNGVMESIQATSGAETGMKWLADKSNCLTVRAGEGYCRD